MITQLTRVYLVFGAALYAAIGIAGLIAPAWLMSLVDVKLPTASSFSEVRAFFGAQSLVIAAVMLAGALHVRYRRPALLGFVALAAAFAIARIASLLADGIPGTVPLVLLAMEGTGIVVGVTLILADPGSANEP